MIAAVAVYTLAFEAGRFWLPACLTAWRDQISDLRVA